MAEYQDVALDWDVSEADPDDGRHGGWTVLPEGYYPFRVEKMERERYQGSSKMPQCPMAKLTLGVTGADGSEASVQQRLYLTQRQLWKVSAFMESIGRPRNEAGKVVIDWAGIEGATGWLKLKVRTYTGRDGQERETNDVEFFCRPSEQEKAWAAYDAACRAAQGETAPAPQPGNAPQASQGGAYAPQQAAPQQVPAQAAYAPNTASQAAVAAPAPQYAPQPGAAPVPVPQQAAAQAPWGIQ